MASKNLSPQGPKPKDDPTAMIQEILKMVNQLHTKLPSSQTSDIKKKFRSTDSESNKQIGPESTRLVSVSSAPVILQGQEDSENVIRKLQNNLSLLKEGMIKVQELRERVGYDVGKQFHPLDYVLKRMEFSKTQLTKGMKKDLEDINKKVFNLMVQVPLLPKKRRKHRGSDSDGNDDNNGKTILCLPGIHANDEELKRLAVFRDVQDKFKKLSTDRQICLLSFAVFPENQEVNRTMLMYWWIGEGILPDKVKPEERTMPDEEIIRDKKGKPEKERREDVVKAILKEFMDKRLIEAVENKRKVEPNSYKMTPFVHSSVVLISKEIGLFNMYHRGKMPQMKQSELHKVCLVEGSSSQPEAKAKNMPEVDYIETVFNVSERFPDFTLKWFMEKEPSQKKKLGCLSKFKYENLKVFYLGRWERTPNRHIEVGNPELMKNLEHMTKLRLLSLQGISRIEKLDSAVLKLRNLIILDLRACYNLEKIPDNIDALKYLTYLDMSGCYMIDYMPKRLCWLNNLEVLKGFVINDAIGGNMFCTLVELKYLDKLRKLSITINDRRFGVAKLIEDIKEFRKLESLKVAWGGKIESQEEATTVAPGRLFERVVTRILRNQENKQNKPTETKLPKTLKKLDLQCFTDANLPAGLNPQNLDNLEKLYIKGGVNLTGFGKLPEEPTQSTVQVLRLKFLPKLKVDWVELSQQYFPQLSFLEKYQCPQVSFCPSDGMGIWRQP